VVNTCGFIDSAVEESLDAIGEAIKENGKVIVTGCLGARGNMVQEAYPEVLAVSGPHAPDEVLQAVHTHFPPQHDPHLDLIPPQGIKLTPRHYAYLKISEGCNHKCSFCIIPDLRGKLVSRPIDQVMQDAENLVQAGVRELLVVSQDTSAYGVDIKYRSGFWKGQPVKSHVTDLARALGELGVWVRLHYVYPYPHVDELLPLMAEGKIIPYLDIPFQHASHDILKAMKRPAATENTLARIQQWREICPEISLRSTFIVGFPGETEAHFQELLDFLDQAQLDRVGCFAYSPVEGARANNLSNPVPEALKQERLEQFMLKQAGISEKKLQKKVGQKIEVLVDEVEDLQIIARSKADAPEIDGLVFINEKKSNIKVGELVNVEVIEADKYDLTAKLV
jgi:ribosomal protein S12 methylthiotransferase